ncbi:hypothetical protein QQP08_003976 [Theobroma cacao]|nr:hypothetical protein QQP08_003976 [Theobroma cacao]
MPSLNSLDSMQLIATFTLRCPTILRILQGDVLMKYAEAIHLNNCQQLRSFLSSPSTFLRAKATAEEVVLKELPKGSYSPKERIKKTKDEKKAKKAEVASKQQKTNNKGNTLKRFAPKV